MSYRECTCTTENPSAHTKKPPKATAATLISGSSSTGPTCCYCVQPHKSGSCESVKLVEDRRRILQRAGRCFVCLRKGHISGNFRTNLRCTNCRGCHHMRICPRNATMNEAASSLTTSRPRTICWTQPNCPITNS